MYIDIQTMGFSIALKKSKPKAINCSQDHSVLFILCVCVLPWQQKIQSRNMSCLSCQICKETLNVSTKQHENIGASSRKIVS